VTVANTMIAGTDMEKDDVVTVLRKTHGKNQGLFNNAAQSFNHGEQSIYTRYDMILLLLSKSQYHRKRILLEQHEA
jgi:hypothetical protein